MDLKTTELSEQELDQIVEAFEVAWQGGLTPEIEPHLPPPDHPLYVAAVKELVRVDLEYRWERGCPLDLEHYVRRYGGVFDDAEVIEEIAFEEYRLRCQAGEHPNPEEYRRRFGISAADWLPCTAVLPDPDPHKTRLLADRTEQAISQVYSSFLERGARDKVIPLAASEKHAPEPARDHAGYLREISARNPSEARKLARAMTAFPKPRERFCGFELLAELGRGAFARVYLARESRLANRLVVLKVSPETFYDESQTLAQLQHTNIVPVYSFHHSSPFVAICMPYFGATTLLEVVRTLQTKRHLPASGRDLVSTVREFSKLTASSLMIQAQTQLPIRVPYDSPDEVHEPAVRPRVAPEANTASAFRLLEGFTFVQACLWIAGRLAEGLQHAHERGILHRDIKPANILVTEDGQPMLLDFNLSEKSDPAGGAVAAKLGGTLPYMAPEHLEGLLDRSASLDPRSDIFALGVVLYELIAGRHPYPIRRGQTRDIVALMLDDRRRLPAPPEKYNPAVTPAVSAIILKCLAPDPEERYQAARELHEDIDDHLQDRPLRHAGEPSLRERFAKWTRRHPRLFSTYALAVFAAGVICLSLIVLLAMQRYQTRLAASQALHATLADAQQVPFLLASPDAAQAQIEDGIVLCRRNAERFAVLERGENWLRSPFVRALPEQDRQRLRKEMGEILWFWTRAELWKHHRLPENDRRRHLELIDRLSRLALASFGEDRAPAPVLRLRADVLDRLGKSGRAQRLRRAAARTDATDPYTTYLVLCDNLGNGEWRKALPFLRKVSLENPADPSAWLVLGNCYRSLGKLSEATSCFDLGVALNAGSEWAWFNRGLVFLERGRLAEAERDFSKVLELNPDRVEALMNRAVAYLKMQKPAKAIRDLTAALDKGAKYTRIYFMRARARAAAGDVKGAEQDRKQGLKAEPTDEKSWIARGVARLQARDVKGALTDFDQALRFNPRSRLGLLNRAHVLSEYLGKTDAAIKVLSRLIELYPDFVAARSARGVLFARLGREKEALADAEAALAQQSTPEIQYQVAGIYALLSKTNPEHRRQALRLLRRALARDRQWLQFALRDPDLTPLHNDRDFTTLLQAMRTVHGVE